jgi:hypothetical protein
VKKDLSRKKKTRNINRFRNLAKMMLTQMKWHRKTTKMEIRMTRLSNNLKKKKSPKFRS